MSFAVQVNGPMFKIFLERIATVASTAIITFGPEKITCNHLSEGGDLMVSALLPPFKTDIEQIESIKVNVEKVLEDIGESELPEELIVQWSGKVLEAYPNVEEADVMEEILVFKQDGGGTTDDHPEPPRINYPLRASIDLEVFSKYLSRLKASTGVIISYENGPLFLATQDWSDRVEIPGNEYFLTHLSKGEYSSLFDRALLESVLGAMDIFQSISFALGEDLPLVIVGIDPNLKVGYMIAQQV
ncbi:MAG TPA: hypothetical protein PL124_07915 [Candidatus Cloacimonadota bacterium]|nr:hypothetical protein [Candidatus Cloacimonadota bacterium]